MTRMTVVARWSTFGAPQVAGWLAVGVPVGVVG
jgi:hypothetical protein